MMNDELLKYCRYYKGEEEYKGDYSDLLFWEAEQVYVNLADTAELADSVKFYRNCGLTDTVADLPIELLAALFKCIAIALILRQKSLRSHSRITF